MAAERRCLPAGEANLEHRVNVRSKKEVIEQLNKYKAILETVFDGQKDVEEETKRVLLQELLANFEAGVQDNVLVDGKPWEEAADEESTDLDVVLDDTIVEAAWKRRVYPKRILLHVVHSLKAERKLMGLYEKAVKPEEVVKDPDQENIMSDVAAAAPQMVKEAVQVMKVMKTVLMSHCDALESRRTCEGREDSHGRREKNRAAAQRSRKKQAERADFLHETWELLEQRNRQLSREVSSLCEQIRLLTDALRTHEPFCPIMHCSDGHAL